jgi:single-strand DNA-binding protein
MKLINHLIGTVGSDPRTGTLDDGRPFAGFRLAVNHEFYNPESGRYQEGDTSWFDVSVYGAMAQSVGCSISKGDPIIVMGRLRVRDWEAQGRTGTSAEIIADAVGHNLRFGTGSFKRYGKRRSSEDESTGGEGPKGAPFTWGEGSSGVPGGDVGRVAPDDPISPHDADHDYGASAAPGGSDEMAEDQHLAAAGAAEAPF